MKKSTLLNNEIESYLKRENSVDAVRYFFAFSVVISHFCELSDRSPLWFISGGTAIRAFFILSGFLVFNSFLKSSSLKSYINKRNRRVFPAYYFAVLFCFFCGVFFSNFSVSEYFTSGETYKYLAANLSFLNFLKPVLPGVFESNPIQAVNGALWTMKVEILFYASVPLVFYLISRFNKTLVMSMIFVFSIGYNELFTYLYEQNGNGLFLILRRQFAGQLVYFYSGTLLLLYFDYFQRYVKYIFPVAVLLYIFRDLHPVLSYIEPLCFASMVIGFAYNFKYLNFLQKYDNISYGIYLIHFPVIQAIIQLGLPQKSSLGALALTFVITILIALFSWFVVEKPILRKKK